LFSFIKPTLWVLWGDKKIIKTEINRETKLSVNFYIKVLYEKKPIVKAIDVLFHKKILKNPLRMSIYITQLIS